MVIFELLTSYYVVPDIERLKIILNLGKLESIYACTIFIIKSSVVAFETLAGNETELFTRYAKYLFALYIALFI